MLSRKNIIEIFSTFIQFDAERFYCWATDGRLRRSMQVHISNSPDECSEDIWAIYWHKCWQKPEMAGIAKQHLSAYLQEACYWNSQKMTQTFTNTQHTLSDFFQIGIIQCDRILKGFNPSQGFVLKNYASTIFGTVIRETLRQRHEVDICSTWGILRKISQKRLLESLENAGLSKDTITCYVTAWNCFKLIYVPHQASTSRQLSRPDDKIWEDITKAYNSQIIGQNLPQVNSQGIESWMQACAKAARNYLYPTISSINATTGSDDAYEFVDNIPSNEEDSLLTEIIATEELQIRTLQLAQMNQILIDAVNKLDVEAQAILKLYYTQGFTQQQIAKELQIQQYTISRRMSKVRDTLLKTLAQWSQEKLHISMTSDLLKSTNAVMEEWLQSYYSGVRS
ncbi:sigma-70 family RNA polymerase sigma factor [Brunnivagina elsteri]|uniref:Group 3/4 sigma-70 RNA polymerase sigma factor n=1 Tax=Brunnivagina elsteri CCALA 953 TaxID=987040 RepID=A0A2A2TPG6_9CYAN|nr:sigma-70 family RNA polymerase sigma factor [Calothrix elsteri]PAX60307.1 group 3/4 sigma-70 RNA polymerase sigma factor [Calothrix elsteri CCALA 953]